MTKYAIIEEGVVVNIAAGGGDGFEPPEGWLLVSDDVPVNIGDIYDGETYSPSLPDLADAKAAKKQEVQQEQYRRFASGWTHEFSVGTHTLDLRPWKDDKANWTLFLIKTQGMVAAGAGAMEVSLRTSNDMRIFIPASEALAAMTAFLAWGENMLTAKWELDDAIEATEDREALEAVDITVGWP